MDKTPTKHLPNIDSPADTRKLSCEELVELAAELRQEIIAAVSETGGHLASNLGTVELTLALHKVFELPEDKILWDVSHQTYAHKILTGRRDRIRTIRQYGGLSGYSKRTESEYDHFGAGHASTSISAALGLAAARDMQGGSNKVIAVIGDGAMTGGLAFEGMNNAGSLKKDLLVILNDNTWSISKNVGSISKYLTTIMSDEKFNKLRAEVWELTGKFKRRDRIRETIVRLEKSIKGFLVPGMFFEKLGFRYFGPIDGHDLPLLLKTLGDIRNISGPVMLHIATVKGKGYEPAEGDALKYHGVGRFDKVTGQSPASPTTNLPAYTKVFGNTMLELADKDERVVAITAAMPTGTGLVGFSEQYPDRFFDVGIAEAHAACFAAGMATEGARPYLTVYSTFMQRAYDQVIHDMAIQNLPVVICMDRAGLVGNDGQTHHGVFDIAYLSTSPNLTLCSPKDGNELRAMLHHTTDHNIEGVVALRYPRGNVPVAMTDNPEKIEWGTWEWLTEPTETVLIATGTMVQEALEVVRLASEQSPGLSVVNARFLKPFDMKMLSQLQEKSRAIFVIEEGSIRGGFGQAIADYLLSAGYSGKFKAFGTPDSFVTHGNRDQLLSEVGLDAESLAANITRLLSGESKPVGGLLNRLVFRKNGAVKKREVI